jgi:beta-galactosidase
MRRRSLLLALLVGLGGVTPGRGGEPAAPAGVSGRTAEHTFAIGADDFLLDGRRFQIRCGEVHAPRVPREYWRHRLQMARAMGLNTVCAYLFWNLHEPRPGEFNWSGPADAAAFCRLAQEEGLWVILRPGPYSCAEWEMGGLPSWLLKQDDIRLRSRDPRYLDAAKRYLGEVGRVLGPQQITRGGPVLMVQVENEYGFFGKDAGYMGELRQALLDAGFDVPLFACNPREHLRDGWRADLFPVVNFGSDPQGAFKALREVLPRGPLMCGEFYPGWFDTWGSPHHLGNAERYLADLDYMLRQGASFSIYMAHGGTTFGFDAGADRPFKPDTSSYDYDAPISEAGWATEKFFKTRELFAKYLLPGETLPDPPAKNPLITMEPVEAREFAPLLANLPAPRADTRPGNFERYDQSFGCIVYRAQIAAGPADLLEAKAIHDIGQVFLNGERIGFTDRRSRNFKVRLPERKAAAVLDVLVEAMGRVNFGPEVHDRKGIHGPVTLGGVELVDWQIFNLPLDDHMLAGLKYSSSRPVGPAFYRAKVHVATPGDCFLDMRPWGKGYAWVNGHNLGRYWNIGPQQTLYVPGPWLRAGENDIVVLDLLGPEKSVLAAQDHPILDQLRPEMDVLQTAGRKEWLQVVADRPAHRGAFAPGAALQDVPFAAAVTGRYFALQSLSAHDGKPYAAAAEVSLLDAEGRPLNASLWTIASVSSEESEREDGSAGNAIDGQTASFWHTQWGSASPGHPHFLVLDLGRRETIGGFRYQPRPGDEGVGGRIKDYEVFVGDEVQPGKPRAVGGALRLRAAETVAAGQVYLVGVESQAAGGAPWRYAEPDAFRAAVAGPGKIVTDPSLLPMNPFTLALPPEARGSVMVTVTATNGIFDSRVLRIAPPPAPESFSAIIEPDIVTHRFAGLGGGVLFYDNQFDIAGGSELYDWCFADVKTSFLHLLIRPDCEPANDNDDWRKVEWARYDFASAARPLRIAREALRRSPALKIYVSVYSPPAWMKSNGRTSGDGTLKDGISFRQELAEFVFAWVRHAQDEGVPVHYVAFFNEPDWPHSQDGMHFPDLGALADTFADSADALDELCAADSALKVKPRHLFPDALGAGSITRGGANTDALKARAAKLARVDVWGVHDYWNTGGDYWTHRYRELRAFPSVGDKPVWMTEWAQRYRHGDLDSALEYGRNMLNALRLGAEAWLVFEWMHPYGNQSGLISTDWGDQTGERRYWRSKAYQVFRQIANTTPAGAEVVAMTKEGGASLEYLALRHDRRLVVHLLNSGSAPVSAVLKVRRNATAPVECWQTTPFRDVESVASDQPGHFAWNPIPESKAAPNGISGAIVLPAYSLTTLRL